MDKLLKTALTADGMGLWDKLAIFSPDKKILIFHALKNQQRIIKRLAGLITEA